MAIMLLFKRACCLHYYITPRREADFSVKDRFLSVTKQPAQILAGILLI